MLHTPRSSAVSESFQEDGVFCHSIETSNYAFTTQTSRPLGHQRLLLNFKQ